MLQAKAGEDGFIWPLKIPPLHLQQTPGIRPRALYSASIHKEQVFEVPVSLVCEGVK